jgi:hypothetical protein
MGVTPDRTPSSKNFVPSERERVFAILLRLKVSKIFMKNKLTKLLFLLTLFLTLTTPTAHAAGDLDIDFHVPEGDPIFVVENMLPGDTDSKPIDVTNNDSVGRLVAIKGIRTGGVGNDPKLETILDITIKEGANFLYGTGSSTGPKTVKDFFTESQTPNGIALSALASGQHKTYIIKVTFPTSAGNEFQKKSVIFDIIFIAIKGDNIVINEVFYNVDAAHGLDSPKDRGILGVNGNNVTLLIQDNGTGSINTITVKQNEACKIIQSNNTTVINNVTVINNTGGNQSNGNTGGSTNTNTGLIQSIINIFNGGSSNIFNGCGNKLGQNDEWVELFNPTDHDINLKNWTITDNFGTRTINGNKIIKAGGFALLAKSNSTWNFWNENPNALKIPLGNQIGDGLDDTGDHLYLKNPSNALIDKMSWGTDTSGFVPPATNPTVLPGHSTSRTSPGFDTDAVSDWFDKLLPNPGS